MQPQPNPDHPAYEYQKQIRQKFLNGQNLIIQAPTGAGKTRAALEPGIIGFQREPISDYPHRIIYTVPMRVLARGFVDEYSARAQNKRWDNYWYPTIQTGENPEDPLFEGRVIFATVDQMLASFLNIPYGLPKKLDNINAGAMIGSYLIFDEFHLYPRKQMMLTVLAMLTMLKDVSRFVLMSATFSPVFLYEIGRVLGAEVINDEPGKPISDGSFRDIEALTTHQRTFYAADGPLDVQAVLNRVGDAQRVLCVCNTIDRAQQLFQELQQANTDFECRLLHSRFYRHDRCEHEKFVEARFKDKGQSKVLLVATQVVEVGLDISSDILFTECAPAASLIQRAGRCARRKYETGTVYVFQPSLDDAGRINYAPYLDEQANICQLTWDALCSDEFNGQVMDFPQEQQLVKIAHTASDERFVEGLENKIDQRIEDITACMATRDAAYADMLIRRKDQNSAQLYIDWNPKQDDILTQKPWRRESFNISKGQIARAFEMLTDRNDLDADFLFMIGRETGDSNEYEETFCWRYCVQEKADVYREWRFAAHPNAVSYTSETGLMLFPGEISATVSPPSPVRPFERIRYEAERYHEHITGLKFAYQLPYPNHPEYGQGLFKEIIYPLRQLSNRLNFDFEQAERLLRLTLALHDVGKLNEPWQAWARAWQAFREQQGYEIYIPLDDVDPLAHTDYDSREAAERDLQKQLKHPSRGNHAGESAEACLPILWEATGGDDFWMAITVGAIMRHHTPTVDSAGALQIVAHATGSFIESLTNLGFSDEAEHWFSALNKQFDQGSAALKTRYAHAITPSRSQFDTTLMYYLFVRVLRLADQRSGRYWQQYRGSKSLSDHTQEE